MDYKTIFFHLTIDKAVYQISLAHMKLNCKKSLNEKEEINNTQIRD